MTESSAGKLLVASPLIGDPNFERSIVLMLQHDAEGAVGLVLNNTTDMAVADMVEPWADLATAPESIFLGGPVGTDGLICLARVVGDLPDGFVPTVGTVGPIDLNLQPDELDCDVEAARIFAGYSGWGPRQLDTELAADAWFVVEADPLDAFTTDPSGLWSFVLRRQSGPMAWLANYPYDPKLN